jgi:hypothetical protein
MQIKNCKFKNANKKLQIANCKLQIRKCKLQIANSKFKFRTPIYLVGYTIPTGLLGIHFRPLKSLGLVGITG